MLAPRLALVGAAAAALVLTGCSQPDAANDNTNSRLTDRTVTPPTVLRTPVRVPEAEPTVDLPGPTGGPAAGDPSPTGGTTFSPAPPGEEGGEQAETSQQGPDGA